MKTLKSYLGFIFLFIAIIAVGWNPPVSNPTPPETEKFIKVSEQERKQWTEPLINLYNSVDGLDCLTIAQGKAIKAALANTINGLNNKQLDSTVINKK